MRWLFVFVLLLGCSDDDARRELEARKPNARAKKHAAKVADEADEQSEKSEKLAKLKAANASCHAVCASDGKACAAKCILASCRDRCTNARAKCDKACGEVE
jgi:hypothetical protein